MIENQEANKSRKGIWKGYFCDFDEDDPTCSTIITKFQFKTFNLQSFEGKGLSD